MITVMPLPVSHGDRDMPGPCLQAQALRLSGWLTQSHGIATVTLTAHGTLTGLAAPWASVHWQVGKLLVTAAFTV